MSDKKLILKVDVTHKNVIYNITKTFQHVSIKCDDSFSDTEIFKLLSLLQDDIDHMKVS